METVDQHLISDKLLAYLKTQLKNPDLTYASPLIQIQGGYETSTYRFRLEGAAQNLSKPLILRLYPPFYGEHGAVWESTIQNVLAAAGYPVAKSHFVCTDLSNLGGAFFIMDYIPGQPLLFAPLETVPVLLGQAHAELHKVDPTPLVEALQAQGIDERGYTLQRQFDWFNERAAQLPWVQKSVRWLMENRPPDPERLAICHGDFHPLNLLVQDGKITGVLDWPAFAIADPAYDVANTLVLTTIPTKFLAANMEGMPAIDWDWAAERYLDAYRSRKSLDSANLDYYRVKRCVVALIEGVEGQAIWQYPPVVEALVETIRKITGIEVAITG